MAARIEQLGVTTVAPASQVSTLVSGPSLVKTVSLGAAQTVEEHMDGLLNLVAAVALPLPFGTIATASYLLIRILGGSLQVAVTTAAGAAQVFNVSGMLVLVGTDLTAVALTGTATIEYILGGA